MNTLYSYFLCYQNYDLMPNLKNMIYSIPEKLDFFHDAIHREPSPKSKQAQMEYFPLYMSIWGLSVKSLIGDMH